MLATGEMARQNFTWVSRARIPERFQRPNKFSCQQDFLNDGAPNKSLDASGGGEFRKWLGAAKGVLIRSALVNSNVQCWREWSEFMSNQNPQTQDTLRTQIGREIERMSSTISRQFADI